MKTKSFTTSDIGHFEFIYTDGTKTIISWDKSIGGAYATTSDYGKTIDILQWTGWNHGEYAEFTEIQLEEGSVATEYEPYFPSVKMLAEEVNQQKNDLDKLNSLPIGSIIQIEADKDNIETTKQKYGWQYLGTSNIEYESGSANILVTNVYRKNN